MSVCACVHHIFTLFMFGTNIMKPKLRNAGGWNVVDGGYDYRLVRRGAIQRWRAVVKRILLEQAARRRNNKGTPAATRQRSSSTDQHSVATILTDAATTWSTYAVPAYNQWSSLTPLEKQQALFAWVLTQTTKTGRRHAPVDILASGIAGLLYWEHHVQPRHDDYSRAVDCARPIWFLLRREWKTYERDNGHGTVTRKHVWINKNIRLRSRNACQRIESEIKRVAGEWLQENRSVVVRELVKKGLIQA